MFSAFFEDDFKEELVDVYVAKPNKLTKQNVGFVGANKHRASDMGMSGLIVTFDAGAPERVSVSERAVGDNETPPVDQGAPQDSPEEEETDPTTSEFKT